MDVKELMEKTNSPFDFFRPVNPRAQFFILATIETKIMLLMEKKYPGGSYMNDGFIFFNVPDIDDTVSGFNERLNFKHIKFVSKSFDENYTLYPNKYSYDPFNKYGD